MTTPHLTVKSVSARAISVPMNTPLETSAARISAAPFVLVELETEEGIKGRAHAFCYKELAAPFMLRVLESAGALVSGSTVDPIAIAHACRTHFALLGTPGVVGMALSALDVACWDALSRAAEAPLFRFLGGSADRVSAYNSNGLGVSGDSPDPGRIASEASALLEAGFDAVKIRLGYGSASDDLSAVRAARKGIPDQTTLMADYNQKLSTGDAIERGSALGGEGLSWIEEPIHHEDFLGCAEVSRALETPIQIGENFCGPSVAATAMSVGASDYLMIDLMRIGGVSGWLEVAATAGTATVPLSSHLYPEVSCHLLSATATAHWLEYVDWAEPFLDAPLVVERGEVVIPEAFGTGVVWDEDAIGRFTLY